VAQCSLHNPKIKGLNPASGTPGEREKMAKKFCKIVDWDQTLTNKMRSRLGKLEKPWADVLQVFTIFSKFETLLKLFST
jgi:hypothetical protein